MARAETVALTLCFIGDFHWFDGDEPSFNEIDQRVLAHDASQGNVEAELSASTDEAGRGCAHPADVDAATVDRSNQIHARFKDSASRHPALRARLAALPMFARYRIGGCRVGVVHGDAESLAGWRFDVLALDDPASRPWLQAAFAAAEVGLFAGTYTCLPALRGFEPGIRHIAGRTNSSGNGRRARRRGARTSSASPGVRRSRMRRRCNARGEASGSARQRAPASIVNETALPPISSTVGRYRPGLSPALNWIVSKPGLTLPPPIAAE